MLKLLTIAALVTGTVTTSPAQMAGQYHPMLTDETGRKMVGTWEFPDQNRCDQAIKGIQLILDDIADPKGANIRSAPEADPRIVTSVSKLAVTMWLNTGTVPKFTISCENLGAPA